MGRAIVAIAAHVSLAMLGLQVEKLHLSVEPPFGFFEVLVFDSFSFKLTIC